MLDMIIRKMFIVMLFVFLSCFFMSTSVGISQWTDPQKNHPSRISHKVPRGPNPIQNPISAWTNSLQHIQARINHDVPKGPNPIHNPVSAWIDPLQNNHTRINRKVLGGPNPIHNPVKEDPIQYIIQSVHGLIHYKITVQESTVKY